MLSNLAPRPGGVHLSILDREDPARVPAFATKSGGSPRPPTRLNLTETWNAFVRKTGEPTHAKPPPVPSGTAEGG